MIKNLKTLLLLLVSIAFVSTEVASQEATKTGGTIAGETIAGETVSGETISWQNNENVEKFWQRYLQQRGGPTWQQSAQYPDYDKVKEGDTFIVLLEQGPCLMEFFHGRWRRANDVWRWGEAMNEFAGCPYVFD